MVGHLILLTDADVNKYKQISEVANFPIQNWSLRFPKFFIWEPEILANMYI